MYMENELSFFGGFDQGKDNASAVSELWTLSLLKLTEFSCLYYNTRYK